jgi:hypothetical protein
LIFPLPVCAQSQNAIELGSRRELFLDTRLVERFIGDEMDRQISWKSGQSLAGLAGQPIRLRFQMKDADVYSLRFD